ncbi:efflux RND transporter periplasmic adaptor subunit [Halopseudomonas salegens]|uniref:efflux RND transporter periplasmic adaptor subunit n=1 Tax=Halopseudomonas salegens TaxID=1434072 RepID=UPI0012FDA2AC|nr:efflux RND transporter periplasmic adaptor subunit [Halopseudomonas salegens]
MLDLDSDPDTLRFAGVAMPSERASLTFQVGGVLSRKGLQLGQTVVAGELLATLYNPELQPALQAAEARLNELSAQLEQAQREASRARQLHERGVMSSQQREQLESAAQRLQAALVSAEAGLRQRQQLAAEAELRAPFSGQVQGLPVESGEFVAVGQPVVHLTSVEKLELHVSIPGEWAQGLHPGQVVEVWAAGTGKTLQAEVHEVAQGQSGQQALYPVRLRLPDGQARPGDSLQVELPRDADSRLRVPLAAVLRHAGEPAVFRVRDSHVERVVARVVALRGEWAMVPPGELQAGDRVVYAGLSRLLPGDRVEVLP